MNYLLMILLLPCLVANASDLDDARRAVTEKNWSLAQDLYGKIIPDSLDWVQRVEDSIRWQLLFGKPIASWRLTQLLRRTEKNFEHLDYLEKLSVLKAGGCPLGTSVSPWGWDLLIQAYSARYYTRFLPKDNTANASDFADQGVQLRSQAPTLTPFLKDLSTTSIVPGNGCRFDRQKFRDLKSAEVVELQLLRRHMDWTLDHPTEAVANERAVALRALDLALKHNYAEESQKLLKGLTSLNPKDWIGLKSTDRRYLWTALTRSNLVPTGVVAVASTEEKVMKAILASSIASGDGEETSQWLALVDFDRWPKAERKDFFRQLDELLSLEHRDEILLRRALLAVEEDKPLEALQFVGRIYKEFESEDDVKKNANFLVSDILSSYHFDEQILGAVQTALPSSRWQMIFRDLELDAALSRDHESYQMIRGQALKMRRGSSGMHEETGLVLEPMARGDTQRYSEALSKMYQTNHAGFMRLTSAISMRVATFSDEEFLQVRRNCLKVSALLRDDLSAGRGLPSTMDLIRALERTPSTARATSEVAVSGGASVLGAVNIQSRVTLKNPFVWSPLTTLPRRDLLVFPSGAVNRDWMIR